MRDHTEQLALAAYWDREPPCTCVDTSRGTDRSGCPRHDLDEAVCLALASFWDGEAES